MAKFALIRRELKNARIFFVPSGTVLALGNGSSSLTVGAGAVFPDNTPETNYTDYELEDIEDVKEERTTKSETFTVPDARGGYREETEEMVTKRMWKCSTHKTNALLKRLQYGLNATPVVGTAKTPGAVKDNAIDGVMLLEVQNKTGFVIERMSIWARLRLVTAGDAGPVTSKLEVSLEMLAHTSNSFVVVA